MARITLYTENILEDATVAVTGDAASGYPESRLYDRDISLYWKLTATGAIIISADYGSSVEVDFLAIEKHNFTTETIEWQYSDDDFVVDENDAVTAFVQSGNAQIIKALSAAIDERYWRITVTSLTNPQCSEVFMSKGLELKVRFDERPVSVDAANVLWQQTVGGIERSTKKGDKRRVREYAVLLDENDSEITNFRTAMDNLDDYSKSFYIKDHEGDYWMCRLVGPPSEVWMSEGHILMSIKVIEKL